MNIGRVSELSGVTAKTIRYYESIGLIPEPPRKESGYRNYSLPDVETLKFIQRSRNLGFTIKDVGDLLNLWKDKNRASSRVKELTQCHIEEIEGCIQEMEGMRRTLIKIASKCHGDDRPDCPILEDLASSINGNRA